MFIKNLNKKTGILFHHFHGKNTFYKSPGSLSKKKFSYFLKKFRHQLLDAKDYLNDLENKKNKSLCLTFDDGLKCQYKIALPILNKYKIKGFFFIFTDSLNKKKITTETIRFFRYKYFKNQDLFYKKFFHFVELKKKFQNSSLFNKKKILKIKNHSPYYSKNDIIFKIIRDEILTLEEYNSIIKSMIKEKKIDISILNQKIYLSENEIRNLSNNGHIIGLHTHKHNHKIHNYTYKEELKDYKTNKKFLEKIIKKKIDICSYPFGIFTSNTNDILRKLNIKYAFCKNDKIKQNKKFHSKYYMHRENISNLIK